MQIESQTERIQDQKDHTQGIKGEIKRLRAHVELHAAEPRLIVPDRAEVSSRPDTTEKYKLTAAAGFGTFGFVLAVILLLDIRLKIKSAQSLQGASRLCADAPQSARPRENRHPTGQAASKDTDSQSTSTGDSGASAQSLDARYLTVQHLRRTTGWVQYSKSADSAGITDEPRAARLVLGFLFGTFESLSLALVDDEMNS